MTPTEPCTYGRSTGLYGDNRGACNRQAEPGGDYCRKHNPDRIARAARAQQAMSEHLRDATTAQLLAELCRRGAIPPKVTS